MLDDNLVIILCFSSGFANILHVIVLVPSYTLNEIKKTRLAYDNITVQLSKKNTRFQYKLIKKGGRASEFENAIEWLCLSGIVSKVYKVQQIKKPFLMALKIITIY